MTSRESLDLRAASLLVGLCVIWGINAVAIKVSNRGIDPVFCAAIRSVLAAAGLALWMRLRGLSLFPGRVGDGIAVGVLFGVEFVFLYTSLLYTTAASAWILLYTTPFFHAIGAHFLLKGDRLTWTKGAGLGLSFAGIVILLSKHMGADSGQGLMGDALAVCAALFWAATTIYIKRRLVNAVTHYHTLFYQIIFSIPVLFLLSFLLSEAPVRRLGTLILLSVAFQAVVVAFVSYLLWFYLVHHYPVSRLSAFTFLTPVFATLAGVVFLDEPAGPRLVTALGFVCVGVYMVNRGAETRGPGAGGARAIEADRV